MQEEIMIWIVITGIVALIIGIVIGKSLASGSNSSSVSKAEKELEEYKAAVSEHFGKTADLVDNLTSSYKDVFEHLGDSAKELLSKEELGKHIESRAEKSVTLTYVQSNQESSDLVESKNKVDDLNTTDTEDNHKNEEKEQHNSNDDK
ncbi:MAG: DUF1043 family protein [Gammaproteobacteria bacterium]|nr:DUF1043 family protein [Gammaproteobacteria bacterium]